MRYNVCWLPEAEQELAALWLDAVSRFDVTRASHEIDKQLQVNPEELGESRSEGLRITFEAPLGVLFRVQSDKRVVEVAHVWSFE